MTNEPQVTLECYLVTPGNVYDAALKASTGNQAARFVIQSLAEGLSIIARKPKRCMFKDCGCWLRTAKGNLAPAAFCILIPMFPFTGPHTEKAIASAICHDCFTRADFESRLRETLATDYECTLREVVRQ